METRILLSKSWIVFVLFDGFYARVFFFPKLVYGVFFFHGWLFFSPKLVFHCLLLFFL